MLKNPNELARHRLGLKRKNQRYVTHVQSVVSGHGQKNHRKRFARANLRENNSFPKKARLVNYKRAHGSFIEWYQKNSL